jgi:hypothetical protein
MDDKANIVFNISGGNNQILPNATQATQNFYGDKYIEELIKKENAQEGKDITKSPLAHYINNVERLTYYIGKLSSCDDTRALAQVVIEMHEDPEVTIDKEEMVKERFINTLLPHAPKVTTSISNIRQRINDEYDRQKNLRRK